MLQSNSYCDFKGLEPGQSGSTLSDSPITAPSPTSPPPTSPSTRCDPPPSTPSRSRHTLPPEEDPCRSRIGGKPWVVRPTISLSFGARVKVSTPRTRWERMSPCWPQRESPRGHSKPRNFPGSRSSRRIRWVLWPGSSPRSFMRSATGAYLSTCKYYKYINAVSFRPSQIAGNNWPLQLLWFSTHFAQLDS